MDKDSEELLDGKPGKGRNKKGRPRIRCVDDVK
jgi:hypothetical protein